MKIKKIMKELLPYVIIVVVVVLIRSFIVTPVMVSGSSMDNTLSDGEVMILNKLAKINRYDIVVIDSKAADERLIKRVIGLPGDTVEYSNGNLYINGRKAKDDYAYTYTDEFSKVKLGEDEYFVLGDNRAISKDSRLIGPIKEKEIKGTTKLIIFPFNKIGMVK